MGRHYQGIDPWWRGIGPFKVGESVNVAGVKGKVDEMTLSSCLIITEEGHHVTVPNAKIWGNPIRNLSRGVSKQGDS